MLEFKYPDMLAGLIVILIGALLALTIARKQRLFWRCYAIVLPMLTAVLAILAAAAPAIHIQPPADHIIVALDESPAAITAPWHNPHWLEKFLQTHLPRGMRVQLVGFAARPHIIFSSVVSHRFPAWPTGGLLTGKSPASTRQLLAFAGTTPCWIFTTGLLHWRLPANETKLATNVAVTLIPPTQTDVGITNLSVVIPNHTHETALHNTPLITEPELETTVRATGPAAVTLEERAAGQLLNQAHLHFIKPGVKVILFPPPTNTLIHNSPEIIVNMQTGDPWPGDDQAGIFMPRRDEQRVLIISPNSTTDGNTVPGWISTHLPPAQFPTSSGGLERFQAVVLDNVSIYDLPANAQKALSTFVTDTGGGLLIAGTQNAFGPGGYGLPELHNANQPSGLEQLSPLSCLPPHPKPLHVIFLLDVSGSMANNTASGLTRFALAAHAICSSVQLLKAKDRITVLLFSGGTKQLADGTAKIVRPPLPGLLAGIVPDGPTRPNSALPLLRERLTNKALLVVITDGRIPQLNAAAWEKPLLQKAIQLAVVAPGKGSTALHQLVKQTHAMRFSSPYFNQWENILHTALAQRIGGQMQQENLLWTSSRLHLHGQTDQWDQVYLKDTATLLASAGPHPLAAIWRCGMGKVVAMAFAADGIHASMFRSSLLNMVRPPARDRRFDLTAQYQKSHWIITVQASQNGVFLNNLKPGLTLIQRYGKTMDIPLQQTAPGQYQTILPQQVNIFSAAVWRLSGNEIHRQRILVGHIAPPTLPSHYLPATGVIQQCPWPATTQIPFNAPTTQIWRPIVNHGKFQLADLLWVLSIICALAAILAARLRFLPDIGNVYPDDV